MTAIGDIRVELQEYSVARVRYIPNLEKGCAVSTVILHSRTSGVRMTTLKRNFCTTTLRRILLQQCVLHHALCDRVMLSPLINRAEGLRCAVEVTLVMTVVL